MPEALDTLREVLEDGEEVEWFDRPDPARWARAWGKRALFGVPFLGFALAWEYGAVGSGNLLLAFIGLPFIAAGIVFAFSPLWQYRVAQATLYAITSRRVLIVERFPRLLAHTFAPGALTHIECREVDARGVGTVIFAHRSVKPLTSKSVLHKRGDQREAPPRVRQDGRPDWGFYGVAEAKKVEAALRALKARAETVADA